MKEQLYGRHTLDWYRCKRALILILFGLLKKYTIANLLVHEIANILDAPTEKTPGSAIVFAILLYSAQQYADFSGGIDIVMGVAELFGIEMMPNFRQPYFSVSWEISARWHISLGAWMRDYVFYPFALTAPMQNLEMGEKASECSFWACTSGIYCEYSGIFPCWYLAWFPMAFYFLGTL